MSINFPKEEEATLDRWRALNAFHRQVRAKHHEPCQATRDHPLLTDASSSLNFPTAVPSTPSTMARRLRLACPTMATCWPLPSKTSYPVTGP